MPRLIRPPKSPRLYVALTLGALSAALTLSGVLKPILWDEENYFQFAEYIARHPFDPYGVTLRFGGLTIDGLHVLAPPLLLYWWGGAIALLGTNVHLDALFLLPFAVVYTVSFYYLGQRFAPGLALPLTVMASTSAWALVSFSYMLDFAAAALGLGALAMFIAGVDTGRGKLVIAAGAVAGIALETKYNSALFIAAIAFYGILARRPAATILAITVATGIFVATEFAIFLKYGQSHFLLHLHSQPIGSSILREISRLRTLAYALAENDGPTAIGVLLIAPITLGASRRIVIVNSCVVIVAFGLGAVGLDPILGYLPVGITPASLPTLLNMSGILGLLLLIQGLRLTKRWFRPAPSQWNRDEIFLLAWATVAILVYFAMSPFPAARRMGEIIAASTLIFGRGAASELAGRSKLPIWWATAFSAAAGSVMLSIALVDASNVAITARSAIIAMREDASPAKRWQLSSLASDRYFTAAGVQRFEYGISVLNAGDLLAVEPSLDGIEFDAEGLEQVAVIREGVNLGVRVSTDFFRSQRPWISLSDTRPRVNIFRATKSMTIPNVCRLIRCDR